MAQSHNPIFNEEAFRRAQQRQNESISQEGDFRPIRNISTSMSIQGTINKTMVLFGLLVLSTFCSWHFVTSLVILWVAFGLAGVLGIVIPFNKKASPILAPLYAIAEGMCLGVISAQYNLLYNGIVFQAVALTLLVFGIMLFIYKTGIIKVSAGLIIGIVSATCAVCLFYLFSLIYSLFGGNVSYLTDSSALSIGFSVLICGIAAFNLLLDFHFISTMASQYDEPKYMEWYAGYGLMVTLVWLYIEILKLLAKGKKK